VTVATGINAHPGDHGSDALLASIKGMNPAFVPSRSRKAFIFELEVGEEYLERNLHREAHFIESGSRRLELEHAALLPKGRFLTVAMIGRCIDQAALPRDSRQMVHDFLTLPQIARILPGLTAAPISCACAPRMTDTIAKSPFGERFALIGDAAGSRLNKDGLYSAYVTASRLAHVLLHEGIDRRALARGYGNAIDWLATDNRFGRVVFALSRVAFSRSLVSRITYQAFATEQKMLHENRRPVSKVLWKIASGTADYQQVLREMFRYSVLRSLLTGTAVTVRNVLCEAFFGLKWGQFGRYPTVVLKEQREVLKGALAASLKTVLDPSPEFERMYVIKIRGSEEEILQELGSFGRPDASFLKLRFLQVRHVQGEPNQVGSVIRYRMALSGLGAEMRLTTRVGSETLLYRISEELTQHGKLIFHLAPTRDKNLRLSIYTAFDYKRGQSWAGQVLWGLVKALFPEFAHDVVWNHALCTIKEEVERKHDYAPRK
jgi:hypothetical protein